MTSPRVSDSSGLPQGGKIDTALRPGRTRILILSAPRTSNQFVSVYPALVAIPRTARESHAFLQRIVRLIEMENLTERPGREAVMRRLAELTVIELVRYARG